MNYIGIDLGTSACKLLLVSENGSILNTVTKEYPLSFPASRAGRSRSPRTGGARLCLAFPNYCRALTQIRSRASGSGGQMHGLVALDAADHVIRPAILWNDGRTFKEVDYLNNTIGKDKLLRADGQHRLRGLYCPEAPLDA